MKLCFLRLCASTVWAQVSEVGAVAYDFRPFVLLARWARPSAGSGRPRGQKALRTLREFSPRFPFPTLSRTPKTKQRAHSFPLLSSKEEP